MSGLRPNDEIRIVAPSSSAVRRYQRRYDQARTRLEAAGFKVTYAASLYDVDLQTAASAAKRAADINAAYADPSVKAIIALRGGWAANDVLPLLDWDVIRANPKPFIGLSDITILLLAIVAQGGSQAFLGPTFMSLADKQFGQYMLDNLLSVLSGKSVILPRSPLWSVPGDKTLRRAKPWRVLQPGVAEGTLLGGNLGTFFLCQGTPYQPLFNKPFVLAIEDDDEAGVFAGREFSRRLESILQLPGVRQNLRGLLVGRFLPGSTFGPKEQAQVLASKKLEGVPIIAELDFGHCFPQWTLPMGGTVAIDARTNRPTITVQA